MKAKVEIFKILSMFCALFLQQVSADCWKTDPSTCGCKYHFECPFNYWCDSGTTKCVPSSRVSSPCGDQRTIKTRCQPQQIGTSAFFCKGEHCNSEPNRGDRKIRYCFDGVTPWENEPPCTAVDNIRFVCETYVEDRRTRGTCRFGHCCPKRRVHLKKPILSEHSYLTNIDCDYSLPLQPIYQYAFCEKPADPATQSGKIWLLGQKALDTGEISSETPHICRISSDCPMERVCVNLMHGVRICMFDTDHEMNPVNGKIKFYDLSKIQD
ncbi:unnamed protein product [Caenorhabditis angaria]|uniref:Domain of unknown function DX domain-containing protein n=1 Tax=Caenorhabditis angaria TaxID=860376 RepID=A0A9P1IFM7_9PELO|nr:unnamed protein product [Caenorhabditis angaria]